MALPLSYEHAVLLDKDWYTEDEYFALEDRSQIRWEFLPDRSPKWHSPKRGRIRAMNGGMLNHSAIATKSPAVGGDTAR